MTTPIEEIGRSGGIIRDGTKNIRRKFRVKNCPDEPTAWNSIYDYLVDDIGADPPDSGDLFWWDINVDEDIKRQWVGTATWKRYQSPNGETQFNFDVSVENTRVLVPVAPITVYGSSPPTLHLIGDRCDGREPEGVDISLPTYRESETHWIAGGSVAALKAAAKSIVGCTNSAEWKGHAPGEALMLGIGGARRGLGDWEVTYQWAVRQNQSELSIAGITVAFKGGWDYLWPISTITGDLPRKQITNIAVAKVYNSAAFSALGIGT